MKEPGTDPRPAAAERAPAAEAPTVAAPRYLVRFGRVERATHGLLMISFLGLSFTGLPLLFAGAPWAPGMAGLVGGYGVSSVLHRAFAVLLMATFAFHVGRILHRVVTRRDLGVLWGPDSLVPQPRDLRQMAEHFRWFVGRGPRPRFDRWTYWEKFDYWAVFWGMAIIGASGLLLWFPAAFSSFVPGWLFNVAFIVHGEEALLAMAFIFTVHFFNGHLRPEKFPMDITIFTGRVSAEEARHERPAEWERLQAEGRLVRLAGPPPSATARVVGVVVGTIAVVLGLTMVALVVYALFVSWA